MCVQEFEEIYCVKYEPLKSFLWDFGPDLVVIRLHQWNMRHLKENIRPKQKRKGIFEHSHFLCVSVDIFQCCRQIEEAKTKTCRGSMPSTWNSTLVR